MLPDIILLNQTPFVKSRLLIENTLLASEIVQGYHKNKGPKRITLKVDIAKAFDSVRWKFIFLCLRSFHVSETYIRWLQAYVCTTIFSVGFNGYSHGYFKGTRGLRQGDPLSPYLFVLTMNYLSILLDKAARDGNFNYHFNYDDSKLTHLCFADDLLIFMDGSLSSVQSVVKVLKEFEQMSGLAFSVHKTSFYFAGLSDQEVSTITISTGISRENLPIRYLGVPLCTKKLTMLNCAPLIQRIKSKITTWTSKTLSFAGRLQLLSSVIAGITGFWCSTFILPNKCIETIESLCGAFLWNGTTDGPSTARVAWSIVTTSKAEGGLGNGTLEHCFLS